MTTPLDATSTTATIEDPALDAELRWKSLAEARGRTYERAKIDPIIEDLLTVARAGSDGAPDTRVAVLTRDLKTAESQIAQLEERWRLEKAKADEAAGDPGAARLAMAREREQLQAHKDAELQRLNAHCDRTISDLKAWRDQFLEDTKRSAEEVFTDGLAPDRIPPIDSLDMAERRKAALLRLTEHTLDSIDELLRQFTEARYQFAEDMKAALEPGPAAPPPTAPIVVG